MKSALSRVKCNYVFISGINEALSSKYYFVNIDIQNSKELNLSRLI